MSTKKTILKWVLLLYISALLPLPFFIATWLIMNWVFYSSFFGIFNTLIPMPKFRVYLGLLKRQYMINKMKLKGGTP